MQSHEKNSLLLQRPRTINRFCTFKRRRSWTIRRNTYSPGLVSSLLYVVVYYLLIRYGLGQHLIGVADFVIGTIGGIVAGGAFLTVGPTVLFPKLTRPRTNVQGTEK